MWLRFVGLAYLLVFALFPIPICCSSVINSEVLHGYEGAIGAPIASAPQAGSSTVRQVQKKIILILVGGGSLCVAIFVIIAYRMVRQGVWNRQYDVYRSTGPGMITEEENSEGGGRGGGGGGGGGREEERRRRNGTGLEVWLVAGSLRSVQYRSGKVERKEEEEAVHQNHVVWKKECAVCLSEYEEGEEMKVMPVCGHCFHRACINMWLFSHTTCPICRLSLLKQPHHAADPPPRGR